MKKLLLLLALCCSLSVHANSTNIFGNASYSTNLSGGSTFSMFSSTNPTDVISITADKVQLNVDGEISAKAFSYPSVERVTVNLDRVLITDIGESLFRSAF